MIIGLDDIRIRILMFASWCSVNLVFGVDLFMTGFEHMFEHMFVCPSRRSHLIIRCRSPGVQVGPKQTQE